MGNYIKKYDLGTIKVDLPYARHIHTLPLLSFKDFRGGVDISLVYNRGLLNKGYDFNISECYKLNVQKKISFSSTTYLPNAFVDSDGTITSLIDNGNGIYTFDDESQRIMRPVTGGYEVEYSDFSKEFYNENGCITLSFDKYGEEVFAFKYNKNKILSSITYRYRKKIEFADDESTELSYIKYDATVSTIECSTNMVTVNHYSQVTFNTSMTTDTYTVSVADTDDSTNILYSKECKYDGNNIILEYKEGTEAVNTMTYNFVENKDVIDNQNTSFSVIEITNKKGVSQRLQYIEEKLFYSYEIDSVSGDVILDNGRFEGTVNIHNTTTSISGSTSQFPLTLNDGLNMNLLSNKWQTEINTNADEEGYYLLTGWVKATGIETSFIPRWVSLNLSSSSSVDPYGNFGLTVYSSTKWHFFAHKFSSDAAYVFVTPEAGIETKDVRLTFQKTITREENVIDVPLLENFLVKNSDILASSNPNKIPYEEVNFFYNEQNLNNEGKFVTINDIIRYQTRLKKFGYTNEIYYNNCKGAIAATSALQFDLISAFDTDDDNGTKEKFNISDYSVGTRFYKNGKEHWSYTKFDETNIKNVQMVNTSVLTSKYLNDYLDVIEKYDNGITTQYIYDKGLIIKEEVPYLYIRSTEYSVTEDEQEENIIQFTDEFGNITKYYMDKLWGSMVKIELPNGNCIVNTLDDDKSVVSNITFGINSTDINNNFIYSKGYLSSIESGDLKYDYTYDKGELTKVEKYQSNITTPKYVLQEMVHTNNSSTYNYSDVYTMVYNYDKYDRLLSIDGVLENTYNTNPSLKTSNATITNNKDSLLASTVDKTDNTMTLYTYDKKGFVEQAITIPADNYTGIVDLNDMLKGETFEYDEAKRTTGSSYVLGSASNGYIQTNIEYEKDVADDKVDNVIKKYNYTFYDIVDNQWNVTTNFSEHFYDSNKRLYAHSHTLGTKTFTKSYEYNQTRILNEESSTGEVITYYYDSLGRISNTSSYQDSKNYYYDLYGRLIREDNQLLDKTYSYEYNEIGNIINKKTYNYTTDETLPAATSTISYTYDSVNPDRLLSGANNTFTYNTLGYPITYNGYTLTWTKGRLTNMTKGNRLSGLQSYTFTYNALGQRVSKSYLKTLVSGGINSVTSNEIMNSMTTYDYDYEGRLIKEETNLTYYTDGTDYVKIEYIYDQNSIIGMRYTNDNIATLYYFNRNIFGDVTEIYDTSGAIVAKYAYDAYGNCTIKQYTDYSVAKNNPIRYRGYYYDKETNLFLVSSRYYSPELCRWISPDDIAYLDPSSVNGLNLYCYCYNDPINYYDPSGHVAISTLVIGGLILAGSFVLGFGASAVGQGISYGWDEINYLQAGLDGLIAVGTTALSFTGIPAWGMGLVGAATGFGQYAMDAGFHNQQLTWAGSITSTVLGGVFGLAGGPGSRNPGAIIDNMVGLSDDGVRAINAITNAANKRVLGEISEKGMQATLNLYGRTAFNAVQAAIPGTIRHLMIKGIAPGIYLPLINAGLSIGLNYLYQWLGWC